FSRSICLGKPSRYAAAHTLQRDPLSSVATPASTRPQAAIPIIFFALGLLFLGTCLAGLAWLAFHGLALVPRQDTRITTIFISMRSRLCILIIGVAFVRSAWASIVPDIVAAKPLYT